MDKFTIVEKGYNIQEVNKFIENVITQTESMLGKMKKQQKEVELLKQEIENYKRIENDLKTALFRAQQSSNDIKKQAYDEKNVIIEEARRNASRIVNDALLRAEKIELKTDTLERNMRIFKKKLKLVVEQQLTVIDEIEDLELK
ncbi:MAG: DivIVA domain-containing protein [Bacilli bacterium]|nr:DivIVA domain-containing protein [Bacilli bacterium]